MAIGAIASYYYFQIVGIFVWLCIIAVVIVILLLFQYSNIQEERRECERRKQRKISLDKKKEPEVPPTIESSDVDDNSGVIKKVWKPKEVKKVKTLTLIQLLDKEKREQGELEIIELHNADYTMPPGVQKPIEFDMRKGDVLKGVIKGKSHHRFDVYVFTAENGEDFIDGEREVKSEYESEDRKKHHIQWMCITPGVYYLVLDTYDRRVERNIKVTIEQIRSHYAWEIADSFSG
jgi:hypothetical protein